VGTGSLNPREIKALWRKFLERRSLEKDPEPPMRNASFLRGYRVPLWKGDLYSKGRILFTGDSAGQVLPLTYEGIYYAMKSGELAAEAILGGNEGDYKRLWKRDFRKRFFLIKRLWEYFLKNDARTERLIRLQKRPEVQEASMKLLLGMQPGKESLSPYLTIFRRLFS
jgi:geranylgeranyl reductase